MYYETLKDYLNDQFRLPLLKAIKDNDIAECISLIEFFCSKMIENNAFAKGFEEYANIEVKMPIADYVEKYVKPYLATKDWTDCSTALSAESFNVSELNEFWEKNKRDEKEIISTATDIAIE